MMKNNVQNEFDITREKFEKFLKCTSETLDSSRPLTESIIYSLFTGGKRYRPVLLIKAYETFSGKDADYSVYYFASAIESLHTYSLVHDDLPCMDDDDYRRGKLTCHKKFGEDIAVLTGDALLNLAYEFIHKAIVESNYNKNFIDAFGVFSMLTGARGLIDGQVADLNFSKQNATINDVEYIFRHKTCDLIVASIACGALLAGASDDVVEKAIEYAYNFGFAFQIADDILDGESDDGCSILHVVDESKAKELLADYTQKAINALNGIENTEFFKEFALIAQNRIV